MPTMNKSVICLLIIAAISNQSCNRTKEETVKVVINKVRTRNDVAEKLGKIMQVNASVFNAYLMNDDSLKMLGKDSATIMSAIIPNTYMVYKSASPIKVLKKILDYEKTFWNSSRTEKAAAIKLTPHQVVTLASIVEEETNADADKGKVGSVYYNRLQKGMKLEADPTLKYAINDFTLERILLKHRDMAAKSPYSTYAFKGLPPGPICTPSTKTIDAVLNMPTTDYIFFVAQPNFSGLSNFTNDYKVHLQNADIYHKFLDSLAKAKKK
jgi:UPF0755 protein